LCVCYNCPIWSITTWLTWQLNWKHDTLIFDQRTKLCVFYSFQ
jgi:hypothetical protein